MERGDEMWRQVGKSAGRCRLRLGLLLKLKLLVEVVEALFTMVS